MTDSITTKTVTTRKLRAAAEQASSLDPAILEQPELLHKVLQINGAEAPKVFATVMDGLLEAAAAKHRTPQCAHLTATFAVTRIRVRLWRRQRLR